MSRTVSIALDGHLKLPLKTMATCWKITLTNGTIYGFTNHDVDIEFDSLTYLANSGYTPSTIETSSALAVDNMQVKGFLNSDSITESDLNAGLWDYAQVEIFGVNWADLTMGNIKYSKGHLGEVSTGTQSFEAELRGLTQAYSKTIGELYSPSCRADLYDARCTVDPTSFTFTGTVEDIDSKNRVITDSSLVNADGYFTYGLITFTSGLNNALSMEVKVYTVGLVELQLPMPYQVEVGDTYSIRAGCDKAKSTCKVTFNNLINFRGEPDLPGQDKVLQVGGRTS